MNVEPISFPDPAAVIIGHLNDELPAYGYAAHSGNGPAYQRIPDPRPDTFVTVRRGGGPARDIVTDKPQVNVECWAANGEYAAGRLADVVRAVIRAMRSTVIGDVTVYTVDEAAGPAPLPDPTQSGHARYVQSFAVALRGEPLTPAS